MPSTSPGAWTEFSADLSKEAQDVFKNALYGIKGVSYVPIAVATQVVAGKNYKVFCNAKGAYRDAHTYPAMIHIYAPITGEPHITSIIPINP